MKEYYWQVKIACETSDHFVTIKELIIKACTLLEAHDEAVLQVEALDNYEGFKILGIKITGLEM